MTKHLLTWWPHNKHSQQSINYRIVLSVQSDKFYLKLYLWKVLVLQKGIFFH